MVAKIMEMFDAEKISIHGSHGFHGIIKNAKKIVV